MQAPGWPAARGVLTRTLARPGVEHEYVRSYRGRGYFRLTPDDKQRPAVILQDQGPIARTVHVISPRKDMIIDKGHHRSNRVVERSESTHIRLDVGEAEHSQNVDGAGPRVRARTHCVDVRLGIQARVESRKDLTPNHNGRGGGVSHDEARCAQCGAVPCAHACQVVEEHLCAAIGQRVALKRTRKGTGALRPRGSARYDSPS